VWRQRSIFEPGIQDAIEARIDELDKTRSSKSLGGGSIFSSRTSSTPKELEPLIAPQQTLSKLVLSTKTSVNAANLEWDKLMDPAATVPSAPVYAARLNGLLKTLINAESAVAEGIQARKTLIDGLEKILQSNRTLLLDEETKHNELSERKATVDQKKQDVEDSIMRGFASNSPATPAGASNGSPGPNQTPRTPAPEPDRPEVEALTPPGYTQSPRSPIPEDEPLQTPATAGSDLLASLSGGYNHLQQSGMGSVKKRKLNDDEFPDLGGDAMDGLDADVAEMLRRDSGTGV